MSDLLAALEERVASAIGLIGTLRGRISELEAQVAATPRSKSSAAPRPPGPDVAAVMAENERLLSERAAILERIRSLIGELDSAGL
jgi:FtsZ-binding cell division protein ZapB